MSRDPSKQVLVGGEVELPYDEADNAPGPVVRPGEVAPVGRSADWSLTGLAAGHRLLNPTLIRAAGLSTDPVALVWAENGFDPKDAPYVVDLGWEAFPGVPAPESHTLLACPEHLARVLVPALARVVFGTPGNVEWAVVHQRVPLLDLKLLKSLTHQPPTPPTVPVDVFGLESPKYGTVSWKPPPSPWTGAFSLVRTPPPSPTRGRRPFSTSS